MVVASAICLYPPNEENASLLTRLPTARVKKSHRGPAESSFCRFSSHDCLLPRPHGRCPRDHKTNEKRVRCVNQSSDGHQPHGPCLGASHSLSVSHFSLFCLPSSREAIWSSRFAQPPFSLEVSIVLAMADRPTQMSRNGRNAGFCGGG